MLDPLSLLHTLLIIAVLFLLARIGEITYFAVQRRRGVDVGDHCEHCEHCELFGEMGQQMNRLVDLGEDDAAVLREIAVALAAQRDHVETGGR